MTEVCLIDWDVLGQVWTLQQYGKMEMHFFGVGSVLDLARQSGCLIAVNEGMASEALVRLLAAARHEGIVLRNRNGVIMRDTPVPESTVRYITRQELGNILPEGWFIEQQLGKYCACHGEEMTLPYRVSIQRAIMDIHAFLGATIAQASGELVHSLAACLEQQSFDI